jgi:NAD-dependent dihydropyrimidine dehydrogenase PreA subunit
MQARDTAGEFSGTADSGDTCSCLSAANHGELTQAWRTDVTYVIAEPCVDVLDRACVEECPVDCIYEGGRMLYIHPDECVDCGACEPVCPVEAIFYEDDVPAEWADYTRANVDFFDDLGSPGGASKVGKISRDDPLVAALPPMGEAS